MMKRVVVGGTLALGLIVGIAFAISNAKGASALPTLPQARGGTTLLFDSASWLVWLAPFVGLFAAGLTRRKNPVIEGDRVLRHDDAAILEHWSHGVATLMLLVTGFALGALGLPRFVDGPLQAGIMLNIHYIAVVLFLFGTTYYAANTLLSGRFKEHMPENIAGSLGHAVAHYRALFSKAELPAEGKYFASEHLTYPIAVLGSALVFVTGLVKVAAHAFAIPGAVMGPMTLVHDASAAVLGVFLVAHAIAGALVPWSWPLLRSMLTGYVSVDYAKHHHKAWFDELSSEQAGASKPAPKEAA